MEGLTLEQLQKMGAKPVQRTGGVSAQDLEAQGAVASAPPAPTVTPRPTSEFGATFPSSGEEGVIGAPLKTAGNLPKSAFNFAKNTVKFLNPLNTLDIAEELGTKAGTDLEVVNPDGTVSLQKSFKGSDVIKGIPKAAYETLIPQFFQALFSGDMKKAQKIITEDPVGQLAPVLLLSRGMAEKAGYGPQFDSVMSKTTRVATSPIRTAGKLTTNTLGITTGAGGEAVRTAFKGGKDFTDAMRGKTSMQEVLQESQGAVGKLIEMRRTGYQTKLKAIKGDATNLDISPIQKTLQENLEKFNVKPVNGEIGPASFERSTLRFDPAAQGIFKDIYDTMKGYGLQKGDRHPIALDTLKKNFDDLYSPNSSVRSFSQSMKDSVSGILKKNVKGYEEMTKEYAQYSDLLKDIKQNLAVGGKVGEEAAIKRLSGALKQNNELRLEVLGELERATGINLKDKVAGAALGETIPRGLIGKGIDLYALTSIFRGVLDPSTFAQILATSPRVVGELMNGLGISSRGVWKVVKPINEAPMILFTSGAASGGKSPREPGPESKPLK